METYTNEHGMPASLVAPAPLSEGLQDVRVAYGVGDHRGLESAAAGLLRRIKDDDAVSYVIGEPQLSALLIMAIGYGSTRCDRAIHRSRLVGV